MMSKNIRRAQNLCSSLLHILIKIADPLQGSSNVCVWREMSGKYMRKRENFADTKKGMSDYSNVTFSWRSD